MFRVTRILIVLVALGALWVFWPFGKFDGVVQVEPPQQNTGGGQLFTRPLSKTASTPEARSEQEDGAQDLAAVPGVTAEETQPPKPQLQPKRFYQVVVQDGGSLKAGNTSIRLEGIEVEGLSGQCEDTRGQAWPCGRFARSALTRLIRGRAVICHVPIKGQHEALTARCSVGGTDLSLWMVAQGWAKPKAPATATLKTAADAAQERRLGIWR
ncbi:hypothetical protein AUC68_02740 [Methyloceanibacter methanicus]|uniref:TNase-like domain-containing protein n=1 Tax=Methyloceanibacter methanicus TaxID=1774968 RepID=A0A1E3W3I1_9HYPH|nr:thermonuclease family protein [Methyloceanibacter methanicus]ODS00062.1 hypothetical protein AUC68_02740 [Methyloceanibacter methanicus]